MNIKRGYSWRKVKCAYFPCSTIVMYSNNPGKFQENFSEVQTATMVTEIFTEFKIKTAFLYNCTLIFSKSIGVNFLFLCLLEMSLKIKSKFSVSLRKKILVTLGARIPLFGEN